MGQSDVGIRVATCDRDPQVLCDYNHRHFVLLEYLHQIFGPNANVLRGARRKGAQVRVRELVEGLVHLVCAAHSVAAARVVPSERAPEDRREAVHAVGLEHPRLAPTPAACPHLPVEVDKLPLALSGAADPIDGAADPLRAPALGFGTGESRGVDVQEEVQGENAEEDVDGEQDTSLCRGVTEHRVALGPADDLFGEEKQLHLARALAGLLSPEPGSLILGAHGGRPEKGLRVEMLRPNSHGVTMFCHSPESWVEMWETVFEKGTVKVEATLKEVERRDLVHLTEETRFYLLQSPLRA